MFKAARAIVDRIGGSDEQLERPWVRWICALNGWLAAGLYVREWQEKNKFPTANGERKGVARCNACPLAHP